MKCLEILGITRNDWWSQALREMPEIFRHYMKCLITQIACNIYIYMYVYNGMDINGWADLINSINVSWLYVHVYTHVCMYILNAANIRIPYLYRIKLTIWYI